MCPQFAIVLSGCGVYDGSEIHEAVTTLLALDKAGAGYKCFAPNIPQNNRPLQRPIHRSCRR